MPINTNEIKKRGRPTTVGEETKTKIVAATLDVLLELGYEKTSLDQIASQASVAKKTIYRFSSGKDELIQLALRSWTDSFKSCFEKNAASLDEFVQQLEDGLVTIGEQVLSPKAVRLFRLLQSDFPGRDELIASYQQQGIQRGRRILQLWMVKHSDLHIIREQDYEILSNLLLAMVIAEPLRELALRQTPLIPIRNRAHSAVQLLLPSFSQTIP